MIVSEPVIRMENIIKRYYIGKPNELQILNGISLSVDQGEFVSIVGESGSGKSVGMLTLMGLLASNGRVEEGEILFDGENISPPHTKDRKEKRAYEKKTASLLKMAQEIGVITSMDVTKDPTGRWNEILSPCYPYLDYFLPSEEQAMLLAGTEDVEAMADFFLEGGVKCVVIKLGSRGCFCKTAQLSFYCGCYDVPVVETTGAGDAFVAGFLSGVLRNGSMEDCVRLGTAASAHVIQCVGANTGIRDLKTLLAFIGTHPLEIRYTGK